MSMSSFFFVRHFFGEMKWDMHALYSIQVGLSTLHLSTLKLPYIIKIRSIGLEYGPDLAHGVVKIVS
jgi:hypothetical protein